MPQRPDKFLPGHNALAGLLVSSSAITCQERYPPAEEV